MELGINILDLYRADAQVDREFREGCLEDTLDLMLSGEPDVGLILLHHYIYSTMGFEKMGELIGKSPDDLEKMLLPPNGDPPASTLFKIIGLLLDDEGVDFNVSVVRRDAARARNGASEPIDLAANADGGMEGDEALAAERLAVSAGAG